MVQNSIYKQVIHLYDIDRDNAKELAKQRKTEIYAALPRVREIDEELRISSMKIARALLSEASVDTKSLKHRSEELTAEKQALMVKSGYPADYLTNIYTCGVCKDTGYVGVQKCRCLKQRLMERYYSLSNLNGVFETENFESFNFEYYSDETDSRFGISPRENIRKIYEDCMNFVLNFRTEFSNLLFYGNTGLGKTFLSNCIANDLLSVGTTVLYVTAPRFFKKIEDFRFNRDEQEEPDNQLELIYDVDLLIIDDLGSEFSTVITNTELFNIINTRLIEKRPTIISTNLTFKDLQNTYTDRLVSRIIGNYTTLRLFGEDIRIKKKLSPYM